MLLTEVQSLDIISVNIWQILISLINLLLLFLIIKKFLFKPVQNMLAKRKASIDADYEEAAEMKKAAAESEKAWNMKLEGAQAASDAIIDEAKRSAKHRSDEIIAAANDKAAGIIRRVENDAELEKKKAQATIRDEIIDVSTMLTEKLLSREINEEDHRELISSFIDGIGEDDGHDS